MIIEQFLQEKVSEVIDQLYGQQVDKATIQINKTRKDFDGDFTVVTFPLLRISKKSPEQTGEDIGAALLKLDNKFANFNVVKGFLNLELSHSFWLNWLQNLANPSKRLEGSVTPRSVMIEYSSPNTNKPLHLGHIRNILLGYSMANILRAVGHKVLKTQVINDRGIHICKSMLAWQKWGNGETPESSGLKGDKLVGKYYVEFDKHYKAEIGELVEGGMDKVEAEKQAPSLLEAQEMLRKWEAKDPNVYTLWETMNGWVYSGFDTTYKNLGVDFDNLYYESTTYLAGKDEVLKGLSAGKFYQKDDGSVWADLTDYKLDQKLLLRSDGTSVYMTQDIGTALLRVNDVEGLNQLIYTVGNEQDYHFKALFSILDKLGFDWAKNCYHLSYGMVDLPSGKMKSREGTVVDADDLMAEMITKAQEKTEELGKVEDLSEVARKELFRSIGMAGLKYFMLKVDPRKRMLFDPKESIDFNGNTGPFIQYTHARISAILKRFENSETNFSDLSELHEKELEVVKKLYFFTETIKEAAEMYSPAEVANYTYDLVKSYNSFYQSVKIFDESNTNATAFRVSLSQKVGQTIAFCLNLLGIDAPEQM